MKTNYILISEPLRRLRLRRVNEELLAKEVSTRASDKNKFSWIVAHGGSVCNNYGYPANTEGAVIACIPRHKPLVWVTRLPANKVTLSGVIAACLGEALRPVVDKRFSKENKKQTIDRFKEYVKTISIKKESLYCE